MPLGLAGWEKGEWLVDLAGFAGHVVHEEILAEGVGSGEVGFAVAHFGNFLDEVDEGTVAAEHRRLDSLIPLSKTQSPYEAVEAI